MKKVLNIKNIGLLVIIVLITILTINTKEAKAAGTVTWSGPSSITIRETIRNIANPIVASKEYYLMENFGDYDEKATATINYTASDMPTNYQITKSTTMNLSSLAFTKPGDYEYFLDTSDFVGEEDTSMREYITYAEDCPVYRVTISVRNVVDANNTPTGNFTASLILEKGEYNEQTGDWDVSKVSPSSGVLYADFYSKVIPEHVGHIELSKTVKGIGADTTKYFPFTIDINNDEGILDSSGWVYPITGIDSTVTYNGNTITNPTTITDGTPTTIYLKHGQTAIIGQVTSGGNTFDAIPIGNCIESEGETRGDKTCYGSYYTITENPGNYEPMFFVNRGSNSNSGEQTSYDYSKPLKPKRMLFDPNAGGVVPGGEGEDNPNHFTISPEEFSGEGYYVRNTGVGTGANIVEFENTKEMSPVTGLIFTILPYLILAAIGVGGTLLIIHLKKEEKKVSQ